MMPINFSPSMTTREPISFSAIFCHSIEYCGVRTNAPNVPTFLFKQMFYGHTAPPFLLVGTFGRRLFLNFSTHRMRDLDLGQYGINRRGKLAFLHCTN
jgi:hypothetical protein